MKKTILVVAALASTYAGMAQDKYVSSALTALSVKNLDEAKQDIDKAIANPETKEKPKALFAKAQIYFAMQMSDKYKASNPYREGTQALLKLVEVKPDYKPEEVNPVMMYGAFLYYNDGIKTYDEKKYADAAELLKYTVKIHNVGGGKRFEKLGPTAKSFDTVAVNAEIQVARCAYGLKNNEEVIRVLNNVKGNPIAKNKDNYIILLESYEAYNKDNGNKMANEELAAIQEARTAFPDDPNIRNMEMNSFMRNGKMADLLKKMEEGVAKEPNNSDLNYNLGVLYMGLANPKDGKKPANAAEYLTKSETAFATAVKLSPDNPVYNYNFGTLFYDQAYNTNEMMNAITGTTAADNKKYEDLKTKRNAFFAKAQAPYEKAYSIYNAKPKMDGSDQDVYHATLVALKQIYLIQEKMDQVKDITAKLDAMK